MAEDMVAESATLRKGPEVVSGHIKWFDAVRGFGFVVPDDGGGDVLVHFSILEPHGRRTLPEGAVCTCLAEERPRGRQATEIKSFDLSVATGPDPDAAPVRRTTRTDPQELMSEAGDPEPCRVKWFDRLKGYGFLTREDGTPDIFLHMETARRCDFETIEQDDVVLAAIATSDRGPLAVSIAPCDADIPTAQMDMSSEAMPRQHAA
ncbi:MAG: cold shock domain-containing protein [Pacificimonas sp.]